MEGLKDLLDAGNVRKIKLTFDHNDREGFDRIDTCDLPEDFGITSVDIGEHGTVFVRVERQH